MNKQLQEIRKKLYLHRDGASSSSMREKGIQYKMNFGVPIITLRQIAKDYAPNLSLAEEMWAEDNRELKILATMIQDAESFTQAELWVKEINNVELAEQCVMNLFCQIPKAEEYAKRWIQSDLFYIQLSGFLLYIRLFIQNKVLNEKDENIYFIQAFQVLNKESLLLKNAALNSLRHFGRKSELNSQKVLSKIKNDSSLNTDLKQELYEDFLIEFEDLI
ncbi:MAG: DNA alkylation repair protein [Bacteroidales bacterium]|nr:DNA alkylation repair protein [Bacteroidales bacterium]